MNGKPHDKFAPRSKSGIFVGYPNGQKGYRIYDLESKVIYSSRDVQFFESIFPFADKKDNIADLQTCHTPFGLTDHLSVDWECQAASHAPTGETSKSTQTSDVPTRSNSPHNVNLEPLSLGSSSSQDQIPLDQAPGSAELSPSTIQSPIRTEQSALPINEPSVVPSKRTRQVAKNLSGYNYTLPPSLAPPSSTLHSSSPSANSTVYPLSHNISYSKFSRTHTAFLAAISSVDEPKYFSQAVKHAHWKDAMAKEISALEANNTWTLMPLPSEKRAIDSKWVYKVKFHPDGTVERYKAQLVAKGYTQIEGLDFHETFAPVAKLVTVQCLLAIASIKKWELHQLDVNNAFLHGDLEEEVYMKIPQGFSKQGENRVCRLQKSLYGLRQASRNWYHKFTQSLLVVGFIQSQSDHSLFTFACKGSFLAVLIYVDDVIVTGTDSAKISWLKHYLDTKFHIKDLGKLKYFLGIEVARSSDGIVLSQRKYVLDILTECGLTGCKPSSSPMAEQHQLDLNSGELCDDPGQYRRLIVLSTTASRFGISCGPPPICWESHHLGFERYVVGWLHTSTSRKPQLPKGDQPRNNSLRGEIPQEIGSLSQLQILNLDSYNFEGMIPSNLSYCSELQFIGFSNNDLIGKIPQGIGQLFQLELLSLSNNAFEVTVQIYNSSSYSTNFTGEITQDIGHLFRLQYLDFSQNALEGNIPSSLFNISDLQFINLFNNKLDGEITQDIGRLSRLNIIILQSNNFHGKIPSNLFNCSEMQSIDLASNLLSGDIPEEFGRLVQLRNLYLRNNSFRGEIPSNLSYSSNLQFLNLANNELLGNIPQSICSDSKFQFLDLSDNRLSGLIPQCLLNFSKNLLVLRLGNNSLHGTIPQTFLIGNNLKAIDFNGNNLDGPIPTSLANCRFLEVLNLGNNKLNGIFPSSIASKPTGFVLRSNKLHGSIGSSHAKSPFPKLQIIDLSYNSFTGELLATYIINLRAMMMTRDEKNVGMKYMGGDYYSESYSVTLTIKGIDTVLKRILFIFITIDFSCNRFTGEIPISIGKLIDLRLLNMSHNNLTGQIPSSIGNMSGLESLDLSTNQQVGEIPSQLGSLTFLSALNLSKNRLIGPIPRGNQFNTFGNDSYAENLALCGFPLSKS
ncbi:LOW QUALITY PROTEIN: hypothetical protein RJ639_032853, partial [Escallonia herrerae]